MSEGGKFSYIIHNDAVRLMRQKAHSRESGIFHRSWNLIFNLGAIGLGFAMVFSCYSPKKTDLSIYKVSPLPFLRDFVANSTQNSSVTQNSSLLLQNYPELQNISETNSSALGLPQIYYFGISGVCRKWSDSNTTCNRTFPPNLAIPLAILQDLNHASHGSLAADLASGNRATFSAPAKAASALFITSLVFTFIVLALIQTLPTKFEYQILLLFLLLGTSASGWALYNEIFFSQAELYNADLKVSAANSPAIILGAGFWVFVAYVVCTLLITPITAFWSLICLLVLITTAVLIIWITWIVLWACMKSGSRTTTTTYGGDSGGFGGDGGDGGGGD